MSGKTDLEVHLIFVTKYRKSCLIPAIMTRCIDCYGEEVKSQATGDLEPKIPTALQKMTGKIERSGKYMSVSHGSEQVVRLKIVQ